MKNHFTVASLAIACLAAAGCASRPAGADILANKQAYLDANFDTSKVDSSVRETLAKAGSTAPRFSKLKLVTTLDAEREGSQPTTQKSTYTIRDLGNGYVQELMDVTKNDIPSSTKFILSYRGMLYLRSKWVYPGSAPSGLIQTAKKLSAPIPTPTPNSNFSVDASFGTEVQLTGFSDEKFACSSGNWLQAEAVHKSLPGRYLELACEQSNKGTTIARMKLYWFEDLGMAHQMEYTSTRTKEKVRIDEVQIER
ncbi:MAG TPA: hypothetical protein VGQ91_07235 [Ideonella sp.]|nr:hypothetical protein [Ideonella sp.]